ncbi:ribonuclease HII [Halocatena pleomorpha]|uniref:Ribonuclease HII n=1 Tax=Halocatena pleomorpha TaxID=1785090 RepID=A0A3P3RF27_9EURY|nr:ribonuclease HII [Halocatena pleomorpha]RRJ32005.1 ribonuclease HII [Halocatena pleomorpha]
MNEFGVDEAGKGPVLGPMVAACVVAQPDALPTGIDDSKKLSATRRESLATRLVQDPTVSVGVARISPARIDDPTTDMNTLTVAAHAEAISEVISSSMAGVVDGADTDPARFARRVTDRVSVPVEITAEHGADEAYPLVGAASVIAKVERDSAITALGAEYGDIGSGYPSDPTTRAFLAEYVGEHGHLPECARTSWKTAKEALAAAEQSALDSF